MNFAAVPQQLFAYVLIVLVVYPSHATALPRLHNSSSTLDQVFNNSTATDSTPFGHDENPLATITFGIFSIIIAFGSLVVGVMQYRRWRKGRCRGPEERDAEMQSISQQSHRSRRSSRSLPHTGIVPPPRVHTFCNVPTLPRLPSNASRSSTAATDSTFVDPAPSAGAKSRSSLDKDTKVSKSGVASLKTPPEYVEGAPQRQ